MRLGIKETIKIVIVLLIFLGISLVLWLSGNNPGSLSDFGLNAFTELLGIVVTVFLIDRLFEARRSSENIPREVALYREVQVLASRMIGFWKEVYVASVPSRDLESLDELFCEESFKLIRTNLNIYSRSVTQNDTWVSCFNKNGVDFSNRSNKIMDRYVNVLEAEPFRMIHYLIEDSFFVESMLHVSLINNSDKHLLIPRPKVLGNYMLEPKKKSLDNILDLINWLDTKYEKLSKYDDSIHRIDKKAQIVAVENPMARIDENELVSQNNEFRKWQESKTSKD